MLFHSSGSALISTLNLKFKERNCSSSSGSALISIWTLSSKKEQSKFLKLSVNALRACVYIYIPRQLSSFRAPHCGLSIWLSLLAIFNTLLSLWLLLFFHEKTDITRLYSKSAIFVRHKNGRQWILGAQSITLRTLPLNTKILPWEGTVSWKRL